MPSAHSDVFSTLAAWGVTKDRSRFSRCNGSRAVISQAGLCPYEHSRGANKQSHVLSWTNRVSLYRNGIALYLSSSIGTNLVPLERDARSSLKPTIAPNYHPDATRREDEALA